MSFWINNGAQTLSTDPGTGNVQALTLTPLGVGIGTQTPYRKFDVVGDIVTSVHGTGTQHDPSEVIGLRRIGHTTSSALEFVGMGLTVKDKESDGTTARANNAHIGFYTWGQNIWASKEVARITERGRLGINTTNPDSLLTVNGSVTLNGVGVQTPAASVNQGVGNVKIVGTAGNNAGPHMIFNDNSDIYPQRQFLNWNHDNIWDIFDCYYDGQIRNSTSTSCFRWQKDANNLILTSADNTGVAKGSIVTLATRFYMNKDGAATFTGTVNAGPAASLDTVGIAKGTSITPVVRFYINKNGAATFTGTVTAGPSVSQDTIGNGDLSRIAIEETKSFNPVTLANCSGWPGGCGTNPLGTHPTANGMYLSNANWLDTLYLPAVAAAGEAFYYQSNAQSTASLRPDRTNLTGNMGIVNGWTYTFVSNGTVWNYVTQKQNSVFNASRVWPTSTTNIGFGTNGQVLTTNGAGSLSWVTNSVTVVADEMAVQKKELNAQKKIIQNLEKRLKALEGKK